MWFVMLPAKARFFSLLVLLAAPLLFYSMLSMTLAQSDETPEVSDFTMVLETSDEAVHLKCKNGCAWKKLTFSAAVGDAPQGVDQYGMTPLPRKQSKEQSDLANFVVTIKRTEDGVSLEGVEGTAFKTLTFGPVPDDGQAIDQNGMTTLASKTPDE